MLALDVDSTREAIGLVEATAPYVAAVKVGWRLMLRATEGANVVGIIARSTSVPVLVDAKVLDAAHIAVEMIRSFEEQGARAITVWGHVGPRVLSRCVERFPSMELVVLTGLTALDEADAGIAVAAAVLTARESGCYNLQVPGNYPRLVRRVREELGSSACLIACGIGPQGGEPGEAAAAGADYEIVGRDLCEARNPAAVAEEYRDLIVQASRRSRELGG